MDRVTRFGAPLLVLLAMLTGLLVTFAVNGFALRHVCVPRAGIIGFLSADLALVRETPSCPASTVDLGQPAAAATVVVVLALPVLLTQLAALATVGFASVLARRVLTRLAQVVAAVVDAVLVLTGSRIAPVSFRFSQAMARWLAPRASLGRRVVGTRVIRGPPVVSLAGP